MFKLVMLVFFISRAPSHSLIQIKGQLHRQFDNSLKFGLNSQLSFISILRTKRFPNLSQDRNRYLVDLNNTFRNLNRWSLSTLSREPEELKGYTSDKYDKNDCKLIIKSGVGGSESFDWCRMLTEMYKKFISHYKRPKESQDLNLPTSLKLKEVECSPGNTGGFRRVEFDIIGEFAYKLFKSENGTHRLIRNSPFNSENKRQTTFGSVHVVPILSENDEEVVNFKRNKQILKKDLLFESMRSSGKGGQNVNKVETAVRIYHKPTGLSVKVQRERTNTRNREIGIRMLTKMVEDYYKQQLNEKMKEIKGEEVVGTWGTHIRTYTLNPEQRVKDHRTNFETQKVEDVLEGDLFPFMLSYLKLDNQ